MSAALSVVVKPETVGERVKALQDQARALARDHVRDLIATLAGAGSMAAEIAEGGDAYPPGVRDVATRLADEIASRLKIIEAIVAKAK